MRAIAHAENELSAIRAANVDEAAVQVMLLSGLIDDLRATHPDDVLTRMNRLARSVLAVLVRESGVDLTDFGGAHYVPDHTDPFEG